MSPLSPIEMSPGACCRPGRRVTRESRPAAPNPITPSRVVRVYSFLSAICCSPCFPASIKNADGDEIDWARDYTSYSRTGRARHSARSVRLLAPPGLWSRYLARQRLCFFALTPRNAPSVAPAGRHGPAAPDRCSRRDCAVITVERIRNALGETVLKGEQRLPSDEALRPWQGI